MSALHERFVRPLGGWLSEIVWRLFGMALVVVWSQSLRPTWAEGLARTPPGFDALALAGVLLALAGPGLLVLALACAASLWFSYELLVAGSIEFIADEFVVQAGVPILGFVLALAAVTAARNTPITQLHEHVELIHLRLFRVVAATTLLLAGLHKINAGFFDPTASCAALGARLSQWWALPNLHGGPTAVVALELACPLLLCCYPRLGLILVVITMAAMAHIGPSGFATTVVVLSLAFLSPADRRCVSDFMRRRGLQLALATVFVLMLSFTRYTGPNPWFRFGVFDAVALVTLAICACVGVMRARQRLRRRGARGLLRPAFVDWRLRHAKLRWPGLTSWLVLLTMVNGLSPYFGFKYRLSVAMLSNLRADDGQWNSYIVPAWVDLRAHDSFIHVDWKPAGGKPGPLVSGAYQRERFIEAFEALMHTQSRGTLSLRYAGETVDFELPGAYLDVLAWAASKPQSAMFQDELAAPDQPQRCIH